MGSHWQRRPVYLRHATRTKNGKAHTYWRLVRSVRRGRKVVQETVAHLGELDAQGRVRARELARHLTGRRSQRELFESPTESPEVVSVRLDAVRIERSRTFGNVWLGWVLWRALDLDRVFNEWIGEGREDVPWSTMASILTIARLCEPSSELHVAESWYRKTALEDMLGVATEQVNDDRLYRALDKVTPHKNALEKHLKAKLGRLFDLEYDLLLYDVTSTYFEGLAEKNTEAKRGHSRDHRGDCKQVCIALVVTRDGIPLGYEIFEGSRVDVTTVQEVVAKMEERFGLADRIWVMDRGMVSRENVEWLQRTGRRYLLGASRSELNRWKADFLSDRDWETVRDGVEVKICRGPEGEETFLLCRSVERAQKERGMHDRFSKRIEEGLVSLEQRIKTARKPLEKSPIDRQIGRLLERNSRAASKYDVDVLDDSTAMSGLRLEWKVRPDWEDWANVSEGCYVLRSNVSDWSPESLWQTYIQLTEAEAAFRIHKSDLSLRPVWHQKPERVHAHILVCFLAYALWKTLEKWQERAGLGNSPRFLLDELASIQSADVVLPLADNPRRHIRIRCVVRPDKEQAMLLDRLGLKLPQRLRTTPGTAEM